MAEILRSSNSSLSIRKLSINTSPVTEDIYTEPNYENENTELKASLKTKEELESAFSEELAELKEIAYAESFSKGYEDGQLAASQDFESKKEKWQQLILEKENHLEETISRLEEILANIDASFERALLNLEPAAVSIAFAGLTRLLGQSDQYRERLAQQVHHAIEQFGHETPARILLSVTDAKLLRNNERLNKWSNIFFEDEALSRGSCIIEAGPRSLEAGLVEQLNILMQTLLKLGDD